MENPLYDLILPCVNDDTNDKIETQAVVTRSHARKKAKPIKPLKVIGKLGDDVIRDKFVTLQQQDASLTKFMKEANQKRKIGKSDVYFKMKDGILYRFVRILKDEKFRK